MSKYVVVIAFILILSASISVLGDSLWAPTSSALSADAKARKVGDLITVRIVEGTSSTNKASTDISKQFKHSNEAGLGPLIKNIPEIGYNSTQSGKASGASNISSSLITTVTATVTKVLDSGNLEITADRELMTNGEKQHITLSAVVRPLDIGSDNSVSSTYLADVKVACSGKGAIGDRQREGIITKILGFLF